VPTESPDLADKIQAVLLRLREDSAPHDLSTTALVGALYSPSPAVKPPGAAANVLADIISTLRSIMPETERDVISLCADPRFTDLEQLVIMRAALQRLVGPSGWLHYRLADLLRRLTMAGAEAARAPSMLHAMLILVHTPDGHQARPLAHELVARELAELSPADAVRSGIAAAMAGQIGGLRSIAAAAHVMQLEPPDTPARPNLRWIQRVRSQFAIQTQDDLNAVTIAEAAEVSTTEVVAGEQRTLPRPEGDSSHYIFATAERAVELPPVRVHCLRGGAISLDLTRPGRTEFYVFDSAGNCIEELSWGICPFRTDAWDRLAGRLAVIGDRFSGTMNVCHFLLDHLTRIAVYDRLPGRSPTLLLGDPYTYYLDVLAAAGLRERLHCPPQRRFTVAADELLVSSNIIEDLRHPAHLCAAWATSFVLDRLAKPARDSGRRLFVSRSDTSGRRITNEPQVAREFASRGFEIVLLTRLSVSEQIDMFAGASCVAGVHGAGLTNMIFSAPGTRVLEILPPFVATPAYWVLATQLGHRYRALIAEDPQFGKPDYTSWQHSPELNRRDISIPPEAVRSALDALLQ
jgi:Glycosyltransferase 61